MFDYIKNELFYNLDRLIDGHMLGNKDQRIVLCGLSHYVNLMLPYLISAGINKNRIIVYDEVQYKFRPSDVFLIAEEKKDVIKNKLRLKYGREIKTYPTIVTGLNVYKLGSHIRKTHPNMYNAIFESIGFSLYKAGHRDLVDTVAKNRVFKNVNKNKRCFILGNGPSLGKIQLSSLRNEKVFCVNQFMSVKRWEDAYIDYWVCIDGDLLGMWANAQNDFFSKLELLRFKNVIAFVPIEAKRICQKNGFDAIVDLYYLNPKLQYINLDSKMKLRSIDISRLMMQPYNAVIAAINIAIYMGFSEIYLLGCDQSVLLDELKYYFGEQQGKTHAYDDVDHSRKTYIERIEYKGMYFEIKTQLTQLMQFSLLADYCNQNGIRLVNLTEKSLISSIKKESIESMGLDRN